MRSAKFIIFILCCCACWASAATPLFEKPRTYKQHKALLIGMVQAVKEGNIKAMEEICRRAVELMPDDATWHYNLACALAYREDKSEALDTLERAVELGFRNVEAIEKDSDLKALQSETRFAQIIAKARALRNQPVPGAITIKPPSIMMGLPFEINPSNTIWNMDNGCFQSFCKLVKPMSGVAADDSYQGAAADLISSWIAEGSAAGNGGDLYMNRDRGHSMLQYADYPLLTPVVYCQEAVDAGVDQNLPNTIFDFPLIGNCSMAMTKGPYWRSLPRAAMVDQFAAIAQSQLYLANQMWVYPEHQDYDAAQGDLFPVNAPFFTIIQGSSFADKPFVRAFAAAMAALRPETKQMLVANRLLAPALQMLFRYSSNLNREPGGYLSGKAHPVVFSEADLNLTNFVHLAHSLRPDEVVPPAILQVIREEQSAAGAEYFDRLPEALFNTPTCIGRVFRGRNWERGMTVRARSPRTGIAQFKWVLLQGDPKKVQIKELDANGAQVEIKIGWHGWYRPVYADGSPAALMSSRVDIACFIKGDKYYSAPSVISVYCDPAEQRLYSSDGRIVSIDYANPNKHYTDPALAVLKPWKDLFDYTENNELKGWYRKLGDRSARFTYAGHRVLSTDKLDRPLTACAVDYLPRETSGSTGLPVMTFADSSRQFKYLYKSESDLIGTFELLRH